METPARSVALIVAAMAASVVLDGTKAVHADSELLPIRWSDDDRLGVEVLRPR